MLKQMTSSEVTSKPIFLPIDRVAIALMLVLSLAIALVLWQGDRAVPRVRDFSGSPELVSVAETKKDCQVGDRATTSNVSASAQNDVLCLDIHLSPQFLEKNFTWNAQQWGRFVITFSRPMDRASVEDNLRIEPPLPGKISWAGRRMAYTLTVPPPYGTEFEVRIVGGREYSGNTHKGAQMQPFVGRFGTRDRAFAYIGIEGKEAGRLMLFNMTENKQQAKDPIALTPPDLVVMDFKPYPDGDRILFSAEDRSKYEQGSFNALLYSVTTGLKSAAPEKISRPPEPAGKIDRILDSNDYQNLKYDLSPDGKTIIVQRVSRKNPGADFGLWVVHPNGEAKRLKTAPGGEFLIHPGGDSLAIAQGQGVAILPLQPQDKSQEKSQVQPLDFLPKFGRLLAFSRDGLDAAMVKFNTDYTRSLFLVNQTGEKELLRIKGSIISAQFDPLKQTLYCLLTQLIEGEQYQEEPYIGAIDLKTGKLTPLVVLPKQRDIQLSLSPDGLAIMFDQLVTERQNQSTVGPRTDSGETIATSRLWLLPLIPAADAATKVQPEQLPFIGVRPRWIP